MPIAAENRLKECLFSANQRVVFDFRDYYAGNIPPFAAKGFTIDCDGNLLITLFGGSEIWHINPM